MSPSPPAAVEDEDEEEYVMERIVGKRRDSKGGIEYRVRWEGYASDEDTWEKAAKLRGYAILNEYEAEQRLQRKLNSPAAATPRSASKKDKGTPRGGVSKAKDKAGRKDSSATKKKATGSSSFAANITDGDETGNDEMGEETENVPLLEDKAANNGAQMAENLEEPFAGKQYRVNAGMEVLRILGVKRSLVAGLGCVVMVQYEDKTYELVPSRVLVKKCPRKLIAYYETHLGFS